MIYGTVVVDGYTYSIRQLLLRDQHLVIRAYRNGPVRACTEMPATVYGEDGIGICQSWKTTITEAEAQCDPIGIELRILITHMETTSC